MTYPFRTGSPNPEPLPPQVADINRREANAMIYGHSNVASPADVLRAIDKMMEDGADKVVPFAIRTPLPEAKWRPATPEEIATHPCDPDTFYRELLCKVSEENAQLKERVADLEFQLRVARGEA